MAAFLKVNQVPRNMRPWAETALKSGWTITVRRGGHLCWRSPDGVHTVFTPSTTGYPRALANTRATLRRAGLNV